MTIVVAESAEQSALALSPKRQTQIYIEEAEVLAIADEIWRPPSAHRTKAAAFRHFLGSHFLLIGIILVLIIAGVYPSLGKSGGPLVPAITSSLIAVPGIFLLSGLSIRLRDFKKSFFFWRFNLYVQFFNLGFIPVAVLLVVTLLKFANLFSQVFLDGLIVMACVPMTINNSFILARDVGGNEAAAMFNSVVGNFIGVFISPLWLEALVAPPQGFDVAAITIQLSYKVLVPLLVGQGLRHIPVQRWHDLFTTHEHILARTSEILLLYLIYTTFCDMFAESSGVAIPQILGLVALILILYLCFAILSWWVAGSRCFRFQAGDRVAALFASTQKTVALGIPIIQATFGVNVGLFSIPLLIYQAVQIIVPSIILGRLRNYVRENTSEDH